MAAKPRILTTIAFDGEKYTLNRDYAAAVAEAGGLACLFAYDADLKEIFGFADGLLVTGGGDIEPSLYREALNPRTDGIQPERDAFEIEACKMALETRLPVMAICRGIQVLNVALGGTLVQHVDGHAFYGRKKELVHEARAAESSIIYGIFGGEFGVNSTHHQALGRLGAGLAACAWAGDGVIEGVEMAGREFVVGVQWHPEALQSEHAGHRALFRKFVAAAAKL